MLFNPAPTCQAKPSNVSLHHGNILMEEIFAGGTPKSLTTRKNLLNDVVVQPNCGIDILTKGKLHLHQVLSHLLYWLEKEGIKGSILQIATWSISDETIRILSKHKAEGRISELHGHFDYRLVKRKPAILQLIKKNFDTQSKSRNHAKLCVIVNDRLPIVVTSSSNYTENPSNEIITIRQSDKLANFYSSFFEQSMAEPSPSTMNETPSKPTLNFKDLWKNA